MAAPKGNNFYLQRAWQGRKKAFKTPAELWTAACKYFKHVDDNPWIKNEVIKTGTDAGKILEVPTARPYTIHGLCLFIGITRQALDNYGKKDEYKAYFAVVEQIREVCYTQKFEGATVGTFNSNIIARDLGLVDKQHTEHSGKIDFSSMSDEDLDKEIQEALEGSS